MDRLTTGCPPGPRRKALRHGALVQARQLAGLTGRHVSRYLTWRHKRVISAGRLYDWERGDYRPPAYVVATLARLYRVPEASLWDQNVPIRREEL